MDLEATQVIALSDLDDDTDDEVPEDEKKPAGYLKVEAQKGFPESRLPIYEGINIIGRESGACNVYIPLKSLSKQHACIEVSKDDHVIYDQNSRNKTRMGKRYLTPEVRYNLQHKEEVTFADVKCTYFYEKCEDQDGDETDPGSEPILAAAGKGEIGETMMYVLDEDDKSEPSSDILGATQAYAPGALGKKNILLAEATQLYAANSDDEDSPEMGMSKPFQNIDTVLETPAPKPKGVMFGATQYIPESDDEDEDAGPVTTDAETMLYDAPSRVPLADGATMAYEMSHSSSDETVEGGNDVDEATETVQDGATQAYTMLPEDVQTAEKILHKNKSKVKKLSQKPVVAEEATMKYDMDVESTQTAEEIKEKRKAQAVSESGSETEGEEMDADNMPTQTFGSLHDDDANISTQTFDMHQGDSKDTDKPVVDLGGVATLAYDCDSDDDESLIPNGRPSVPLSKPVETDDQPTQAFDSDGATLAVEKDVIEETQVFDGEAATVTVEDVIPETQEFGADDSTQVLDQSDKAKDVEVDETQVLDDDATMAVSEITSAMKGSSEPSEEDIATQILEDPLPEENQGRGKSGSAQDLPAPAVTGSDADATMILDSPSPKGKRGRRGKVKATGCDNEDIPTLSVSSTTVVRSPRGEEAETQLVPESPSPQSKQGSKKNDISPEDTETQIFDNDGATLEVSSVTVASATKKTPEAANDDALNSTQVFSPDNDQTPTLHVSSVKYARKGRARRSHLQAAEAALDETQIFDDNLVGTPVLEVSKHGVTKPRRIETVPKVSDTDSTLSFDPELCSTQQDAETSNSGAKTPLLTPEAATAGAASVKAVDTEAPVKNLAEHFRKPELPAEPTSKKKRGRPAKAPVVPSPSASDADNRTAQVIGEEGADDASTQAYSTEDMACTQAYSAEDSAATQAYSAEDNASTQAYRDEDSACTQAYSAEDMANTQAYSIEEASADQTDSSVDKVPKASKKRGAKGKGKTIKAPTTQPQDEEATQAYEEEATKPVPKGRGRPARGGKGKKTATKPAPADPDDAATQAYTAEEQDTPSESSSQNSQRSSAKRGKVPAEEKKADPAPEQPQVPRRGRGRAPVIKEEPSPETSAVTAGPQRRGRGNKKTTVASAASDRPEPAQTITPTGPAAVKEEVSPKVRRGGRRSAEVTTEVETSQTKESTSGAKAAGAVRRGRGRGGKAKDSQPETEIKVESTNVEAENVEVVPAVIKTEVTLPVEPAGSKPTRGKRKAQEEIPEEPVTSSRQKRGRKAHVSAEVQPSVEESKPSRRGRGKAAVPAPEPEPEAEPAVSTSRRGRSFTGSQKDSQSEESQTSNKAKRGRFSTEQYSRKLDKHTDNQDSDDDFDPPVKKPKKGTEAVGMEAPPAAKGKIAPQAKRGRKGKAAKSVESDQELVMSELSNQSVTENKKGRGSRKPTKGGPQTAESMSSVDTTTEGTSEGVSAANNKAQGKKRNSARGSIPPTPPSTPSRAQKLNQSIPLTPTTPSLRRRTIDRRPKVMFTGMVDERGQKTVKSLGGELVDSVYECTHLVTDQIRRTVKLLCCISRGIPIVSPTWLERCHDARTFIDAHSFMVSDRANEKKFQFRLEKSLEKAAERLMLENYRIHVTKNVRPEASQMKDIIKCSGAEYLAAMPKKYVENTVVISCDKDRSACKPAVSSGIPVVSAEFILTGVLQQQVNVAKYQIT